MLDEVGDARGRWRHVKGAEDDLVVDEWRRSLAICAPRRAWDWHEAM